MRKTVASWLEENVNVLNGLTWIDKENYVVKITWERLGSLNSKTTIDICKVRLDDNIFRRLINYLFINCIKITNVIKSVFVSLLFV